MFVCMKDIVKQKHSLADNNFCCTKECPFKVVYKSMLSKSINRAPSLGSQM